MMISWKNRIKVGILRTNQYEKGGHMYKDFIKKNYKKKYCWIYSTASKSELSIN